MRVPRLWRRPGARPVHLRARLACGLALAAIAGACGLASASEEVPFITTPDRVVTTMLEIAQVGPNDHVIDLGSGDGRIVIVAARQFGASGLGVEIVPELVLKSRAYAQQAGVAQRVEFREQDLFKTDLNGASVITMYLLPEVNLQLRPSLLALKPGTRIVSHDWDMGDWPADRTLTVPVPDKAVGLEKFSRVHLWVVPAHAHGLWCGQGRLRGAALRVAQQYQRFSARLGGVPDIEGFDGRIDAAALHGGPQKEVELEWRGDRLHVLRAGGRFAPLEAGVFARTNLPGCERKP
jgi:SAM-dependent methyltransferase